MLVPGSLGLISANFPQERRGHAIGTWSGFTPITTTIGPVLGGPEFLNRRLDAFSLPPTVRADMERHRPKLAGVETTDARAH